MELLLQRRAKCITLLSLVFLATLGACGKTAKLAPLQSDAVVLAFGDSLTYGTGASEGESYPAQLGQLIGRKVVRAGVPGEVTAQAAGNVRSMVKLARGRGVDVLLVGTPEPGLLPAPPAFYGEIADELGVPDEKGVITEVLRDPALKSDPIHPNARGYRLIAERIAERLKKSGAL